MGSLWEKTITTQQLDQLQSAIPRVLTELSILLPSWELDMNRHMMLHMVSAIRANGPCWTWSMFGPERMWNRLISWMTQMSHPEATIMNAFRAFTSATLAMPSVFQELPDSLAEPSLSKPSPFYHIPHTFNEQTFALEIPEYMTVTDSTGITLKDGGQFMNLGGRGCKGDKKSYQTELHLYYYHFPALCKACLCNSTTCSCPSYTGLFDKFLQDTARAPARGHSKAQILDLLPHWQKWAKQQQALNQLTAHQAEVCRGPHRRVRIYDRALIGTATLAGSILEKAKKARDSVVLTREAGHLRAGRVRRFLTHSPPGVGPDADLEAIIADVQWHGKVPDSNAAAKRSSKALDAPIFKSCFVEDKRGNFWPVDKLAPCSLVAAPHKSGATASGSDRVSNHVVILNRFASFQSKVPHVQ